LLLQDISFKISMKIQCFSLSITTVLFILQACTTQHYGHTKNEWDNFSKEEKMAIKLEYQEIIDSRNKQDHKNIIESRTEQVIDMGVNPGGHAY